MIEINDSESLSRLLFLSDLYEMVLGVQGDIIHVGSREGDAELWHSLHVVYEPTGARRKLICNDCEGTLGHLRDDPNSVTALVYFDDTASHDVSSRKVVKEILEIVVPYLVSGSILAFSRLDVGEQVFAVMEVIGLNNLAMQRWHHSRRDCYAVV